ncbi:transforming growth factor-beta-induced protein ig-h3 [Melanaphis sacchari]|nr:transforming growth factor-beta-induced protein ig-h3 [Melanaphis sacchari]
MIVTIVLTSLMLTYDVVYGNYHHNRNTTLHKYGPNVCAVEEILSGNNGVTSHRERGWPIDDRQQQHRTCGQNTIVKYECCLGFKSMYGCPGCTGVKLAKNVMETAQELGARQFVQYIQQHGLYDLLTSGGPYTIFVPTDEAFSKIDSTFRSAMESYESAVEILRYHVVPLRIVTQNVSSDELLNTLNDGLKLRFNKYSTKIETINCVTIMRKNRIAQNGVVHLINSVLSPYSYSNRNLVQIINQNQDLSIFSKMLEISRMHQSLKESFQTLTVMVPTDTALQRLPQNQLRRILNDETLSKAFVLKHILPTPICLSAVTEEQYVRSLADKNYVKFSCDKTNAVTVQGNCVGNDFKLSSNGIIYAINFPLSSGEGKSALQIMQHLGLSEFVQIVNIAGLAQTFENFNALTVFAPTNQALRCMNPMEMYHIRSDPNAARTFIDFHVGRQIMTMENIYDGKTVESFAPGKQLRLQCVQNEFGVEGHRIHFQSVRGYNGAVHVVDHVLYPPTISVEDLIKKNDSFSLYAQAMDLVLGTFSKDRTSFEFCDDVHNTYFIPTDYAFKKLGADELHRLFTNPIRMRQILDNHQADRILPSALIGTRQQYEIKTKNEIVRLSNEDGKLMVNEVEIIETDIMTTNGLIHVVDDLILPQYRRRNE